MFKIDEFKIDQVIPELKEDSLKFLNLSGRQAFWSQGFYGQGIIVAVVDSGVSPHPEFEDRLLNGKNFTSRYEELTQDDYCHGTHVAGSIAGKTCGIAPKADILPVKVLDGMGGGSFKNIVKALRWVLNYRHPKDGRKVNIVSMSLSTDGRTEPKSDIEELHQVIKELVAANILVVCSAGNTYMEQKRYPASYDEVVCVGAVDVNKQKANFTTTGDHVDVCQVGVDVISAWFKGGYAVLSGTSMSTPITSGIAALLACKYKATFKENISEDLLWKLLKCNTKDLGIPGVDKVHGAGFCTLQPLELEITMMNGSKNLVVNDKVTEMDVEARLEGDGRFVIPARYFTENTGAYINYNHEKRSATFIY